MATDSKHALISLEEMKVYKREESDQYDPLLEMLINSLSIAFEKDCGGRVFIEATYTTTYLDGTGNRMLMVPHYPVTSIESVIEDETTLTEGSEEDYVIFGAEGEGYLWRVNGVWSAACKKNIKLTNLKAGYLLASVPSDLKLAAMIMVEKEFQKSTNKAGAESTRSFPDMSISWDFGRDEYVKETLRKYRRMSL